MLRRTVTATEKVACSIRSDTLGVSSLHQSVQGSLLRLSSQSCKQNFYVLLRFRETGGVLGTDTWSSLFCSFQTQNLRKRGAVAGSSHGVSGADEKKTDSDPCHGCYGNHGFWSPQRCFPRLSAAAAQDSCLSPSVRATPQVSSC